MRCKFVLDLNLLSITLNPIFSSFFLKCWPIGDPFHRFSSLSTPPTSPTLNLAPLVSFYLLDTVSCSTDQTVFYTYLYLLNFIPYLQIDFAQRCAYVLLVEIGPFFFTLDWFYFINICTRLLRLSYIFCLLFFQ